MTPYIQSKIKAFMGRIDNWTQEFLDFPGKTDIALKAHANEWLDKGETVWIQGMNDIRVSTAYETYKRNARLVGETITISDFKSVYALELNRLATRDLTKARMLRNNIARNLQGNIDTIYKEFDTLSKESFGLSLDAIKKEFINKADFYEVINFEVKYKRFDKATGTYKTITAQWDPMSYAEMWARTRSSEMASIANEESMQEYGLDIVRISDHNTTTPICMLYEGQYFSLTGKTPGLPILTMRPPFHPNCKHTEFAVERDRVSPLISTNTKLERRAKTAEKKWTPAQKDQIIKQQEYQAVNRA